ncbi:hypothetical protein BRC89_06570 [Halobacteriales archaeon QS_4_70_19]|nr:MAG: hypothetical protein BRC89_06570 [Halobacteriales archaeon QS_4_70_19]
MDDNRQTISEECATCGAADDILFTCGYCGGTFCSDHGLPNHSCEGFAHPGEGGDGVSFQRDAGGHTGPEDPFTESGFRPATDEPTPGDSADGGPTPRSVEPAPAATRSVPRRPAGTATPATAPAPRATGDATTPAVRHLPRPVDGEATPAVTCLPRSVEPAVPAVERRPRPVDGEATPAIRPRPRRAEGSARPAVRPAPEPTPVAEEASTPAAASSTGTSTAASAATTDGRHAAKSVPMRTMDTTRSPGSVERQEARTLVTWLDQQTYVSLSVKAAALAAAINGALYFGMAFTLYGLHPF